MPWAYLDDRRHVNAKLRTAGLEAAGLDAYAITYCAAELTDGFVATSIVPILAGVPHWRELADILASPKVRRWERDDERDGWWVVNYLEYNKSKLEVEKEREERSLRGQAAAEARWHPKKRRQMAAQPTPSDDVPDVCDEHKPSIDASMHPSLIPLPEGSKDPSSSPVPAKAAKEPLFVAICEACDMDPEKLTTVERKDTDHCRRSLAKVGASPEEVKQRAANWYETHDFQLTPRVLERHWGTLAKVRPTRARAPNYVTERNAHANAVGTAAATESDSRRRTE